MAINSPSYYEGLAAMLWEDIRKLLEERMKVLETHSDGYCEEAAFIANQISQLIATGKMFKLIDDGVNYLDYVGTL